MFLVQLCDVLWAVSDPHFVSPKYIRSNSFSSSFMTIYYHLFLPIIIIIIIMMMIIIIIIIIKSNQSNFLPKNDTFFPKHIFSNLVFQLSNHFLETLPRPRCARPSWPRRGRATPLRWCAGTARWWATWEKRWLGGKNDLKKMEICLLIVSLKCWFILSTFDRFFVLVDILV